MIGYSSHGSWCPLSEMYELENDDRENLDEEQQARYQHYLNDGEYEALWVCYQPENACRYLRDADHWDKKATKKELAQLVHINLDGCICIDEDGDGGYLYIRPQTSETYSFCY